MTFGKLLCPRVKNNAGRAAGVLSESLESRSLLSAGPELINVQLLGGVQNCTGVVLTFNQSMDPARAMNAAAYAIGRTKKTGGGPGLLTTFLPFIDTSTTGPTVYARKVHFVQASYDDATHKVTLTPNAPFLANKLFRAVRIRGTGQYALTDIAGNPLDGNSDGKAGDDMVITWVSHQGKSISYMEPDGDKVILRLKGRGKIFTLQHPKGSPLPMLFIQGMGPGVSVLSGKVIPGKFGDGIATIAQVSGLASASVTILNNSSFVIGSQFQ